MVNDLTSIIETLSIVSEVELIYRSKIKPSNRPIVRRSEDSYNILCST